MKFTKNYFTSIVSALLTLNNSLAVVLNTEKEPLAAAQISEKIESFL